jgi:mRNA interferase MazF
MPTPTPPSAPVQLPAVRGYVYMVDVPDVGEKPFLVVSNNARNQHLGDVLAVRITTTRKIESATRVVLGSDDLPIVGTVLCDEIGVVDESEFKRLLGVLPHGTMTRVSTALCHALAL